MYPYSDPAGLSFSNNPSVREIYRRTLDRQYDRTASRAESAITWLEAFDDVPPGTFENAAIGWKAFPVTANATESDIDKQRFVYQDEYVEWRVFREGQTIKQIVFTTEFPEYYEAYAEAGHADLIAAIQAAIPGAVPTPLELYGINTIPGSLSQRSTRFRANLPNNPWNNGAKGILCLTQEFNTLGALFGLLVECGIDSSPSAIGDTCGLVGGACGEGRASDPTVCSVAQTSVRNSKCFSLADPAGIRIMGINDEFEIDDVPLVLDGNLRPDIWNVDRGGRRATLNVRPGLKLRGQSITTGAQISREVSVAAEVLRTDAANLPDWARTGRESLGRGGA